ncbi:MAG: hypothetical protein CVV42_15080 [Candidatus Riflebacteria bacterium HGW-Riflebacteria-2]|jgi:hypothetical protein|nr:MAG: hypothetical protein CVV42_15080 [Candidatus Riflebacteria bacterium HGW-Riflebacteria-2]
MKTNTRNQFARAIFLLCIFFIGSAPYLLAQDAPKLSDKAFARMGQAITYLFERLGQAAITAGKGNFTASFDKPNFSRDYRKMRLQITGMQKMPVEAVKHKVTRFFFTETPLPPRKECVGFFRLFPPENLDKLPAGAPISLVYRLNLEINLQECVLIAAKTGVNFAIEESGILASEKLLIPIKKISNENLRAILERFFPKLVQLAVNKGTGNLLNSFLSAGNGQNILRVSGIGELGPFATYIGIEICKHVAAQQVKNLAMGSAGAALSAVTLPMPVIGQVAVGAMLVNLAITNSPGLINWSVEEFRKGVFRDRLGKATMNLMGKYPPGKAQVSWFDKQVKAEATKDDYSTLHRILFFLRLQPLHVRKPWKQAIKFYVPPVARQAEQRQSFKAERYLSILNYLLNE